VSHLSLLLHPSLIVLPTSHISLVVPIPVVSCSAFVSHPCICTKSIFTVFNDSHQHCLAIPHPINVHRACFYAFCTCATYVCACIAYAVLPLYLFLHAAVPISDSITHSHMSQLASPFSYCKMCHILLSSLSICAKSILVPLSLLTISLFPMHLEFMQHVSAW